MSRRYADRVEVRPREQRDEAGGCPPDSFLWRGRLYVVRSVLGHWRERRAWWNEPAARAVHGETSDESDPAGRAQLDVEREVWRVEASAGRRAPLGVYDLCQGPVSTWSLVRVAD
jgi:hypothetical protein